jgi:hypothetical protein
MSLIGLLTAAVCMIRVRRLAGKTYERMCKQIPIDDYQHRIPAAAGFSYAAIITPPCLVFAIAGTVGYIAGALLGGVVHPAFPLG